MHKCGQSCMQMIFGHCCARGCARCFSLRRRRPNRKWFRPSVSRSKPGRLVHARPLANGQSYPRVHGGGKQRRCSIPPRWRTARRPRAPSPWAPKAWTAGPRRRPSEKPSVHKFMALLNNVGRRCSFIHVAVGVWHNVCWGGLHNQCMTLSESGSNINSSINDFICMRQPLYRGYMIHMYCCTHMRRRIPNTIHYQLMLAFAAFVDMYAACGIQWRRRPPLSSNANKYAQHSTWALSNGVLAPPQYLPPRRERCCATLVSLASPPGLHIPAANRDNAAIAVARMCGRPAWAKTLLSPVFVATCRAPPTDANRPQPCVSFARLCYDTLEFEARVGASDHRQHDVSHITSADPLLPSRHAPTSDPTLCAWRG